MRLSVAVETHTQQVLLPSIDPLTLCRVIVDKRPHGNKDIYLEEGAVIFYTTTAGMPFTIYSLGVAGYKPVTSRMSDLHDMGLITVETFRMNDVVTLTFKE
jgi:hypothetical protein